MTFRRMDHVGIIVNDLEAAKTFFLDLGFEVMGEEFGFKGEWIDRLVGLKNVHTEAVMIKLPGGGANLELIKYHTPPAENNSPLPLSNSIGIGHIAFEVEDIETIVEKIKSKGMELVGEIQNYENMYKLCFIRGPEGIILDLAEAIK
ncbi:MAG: VOC family protein [Anaerolineaceae bacterium]|nr:VOC family protein [Anaerolineaceae bacterium]